MNSLYDLGVHWKDQEQITSNIEQFGEFSYIKATKSLNELISNHNMSLEF